MTSYMYNPSKQVTKVLEEYLEFDAEQLKLGIWSGQLSLKDVNLKADAIYPHLNRFFDETEATNSEFTKKKPPVRLKLVSGTIGDLNLDIPWKSLVWGQGDVKVELRNVVVVVALESLEETQERRRKAADEGEEHSENNGTGTTDEQVESHEDQATKSRKRYQKQKVLREAERRQLQGRDIASWLERVYKKEEEERQREAIRSGDPLVKQEGRFRSWLKGATNDFFWRFYAGLQMKIENLKVIVIQDAIELGLIIPSIQVVAGKQDKEHRQSEKSALSSHHEDEISEELKPPQNVVYESPDEDGEHVDKHIRILGLGLYVRKLPNASRKRFGDPERFAGGGGDGGDQSFLQIADVSTKEFVLRPTELNISYSLFFPYPPEKRKKKKAIAPPDVSMVADVSVAPSVSSQSTSSTKRRRGKREKSSVTSESSKTPPTEPTTPATAANSLSSAAAPAPPVAAGQSLSASTHGTPRGSKPKMVMRRMSIQTGNRKPIAAQPIQTPALPAMPPPPPPVPEHMETTHSINSMTQSTTGGSTAMSTTQPDSEQSSGNRPPPQQLDPPGGPKQPRFARRSSIAGPVKGSTAAAAVVSRVPKHDLTKSNKRSVPLARPDDLVSAFSIASKDSVKDLTAHLDGDVQIGPLEVVLSTRHYNMIDTFMSACARMRNGRPSKTIASVLEVKPVRHSVLVTSSELARATSISTEAAETVRLGLNAPLNARSDVVRSWWRYGLYAIRWEIQQRRKVRKHFQDKYLSFSWEQQQYRRKEYVTMYIAAKLLSPDEEGAQATNTGVAEALTAIEDQLPIEQILLYRAIARVLHVGGMREMPDSLLGIRASTGFRGRSDSDDKSNSREPAWERRSSSGYSSEEGFERDLGNNRSLLSLLEETCEISRLRLEGGHAEIVPRHRALVKYSHLERKSGMEESTIGMTLDTRGGGTRGAGFSRATTRRSGARSATTENPSPDTSMKFSFKAAMEKVELMVVEEEVYDEKGGRAEAEDDSSGDSAVSVSDISELTEEERFSDSATQITGMDDESASDPILASTDFLLFRQPEKVLLRTEVRAIKMSVFGHTAGSRNINFKIGRVQALTGNNLKLLEIGVDGEAFSGSDSAVGSRLVVEPEESVVADAQNALSLSLVLQKEQQVVQCDIATLKATVDLKAISSLLTFGTLYKSSRPLMPTTPGENVRTYVVNQNIGTAFRFFDASFRLHGVEITLPQELGHKVDNSETLTVDESETESSMTRAMFIADMVEIYSGKAANNLGIVKPHWQETYNNTRLSVLGEDEPRRSPKTRNLQMLDVDELVARASAFLAFNVVAAASGLDFVAATYTRDGVEENRLSFLDAPVDVETFASINESSVLDYNRAKREVVVKLSEVNAMVSETRLRLLAEVFPQTAPASARDVMALHEEELAPPRLEILARLMLNSFDVNIARLRLSIVTDDQHRVGHSILSKQEQLEDFVTSFLRTVSKLDLSWPHEEALSSAMQICIDRLTGIGFLLDDAWQCSNTALLNFLEDITGENGVVAGAGESEAGPDDLDVLISGSVTRTICLFTDRLDQSDPSGHMVENHLVIDFPEGVSATGVDLFYDHFVAIVVNSVFVTNGEGIHLLRLMPEVGQPEGSEKPDLDARSDAAASYESSYSGSAQSDPAFVYRWFKVNEKFSFGRGGLPLAVLGGEIEKVTGVKEESIMDIDSGELELLFCEEVFDDVVFALSEIVDPLKEFLKPSSEPTKKSNDDNAPSTEPARMLICSSCFSLLFTNEELVPFTRFILGNCIVSTETEFGTNSTKMSAKQLSLLYLAPDGELYPEQVCVHEMSSGPPMIVALNSGSDGASTCNVELRGLRIFMVYQFIGECMQYFYSGTVGFGLWLANSSEALAKFSTSVESGETDGQGMKLEILLYESSVLIPRSSLSSEMLALEVDRVKISFDEPPASFKMPTEDLPLQLKPPTSPTKVETIEEDSLEEEEEEDGSAGDSSKVEEGSASISRTMVEIQNCQMFTSLNESGAPRDPEYYGIRESLAFNCFFEIDGRARDKKQVYHQIAPPENYEIEKEKADRTWRQLTSEAACLKVIVDYAPHQRILVTDEIDGTRTPFDLDATLSQFCLLMSCWYANMSELPLMFPYSATELEVGSKFIAKASTFPEFGTKEYRKVMKTSYPSTSEFVMSLSSLSLRCTTDRPFEAVTTEAKGILLGLDQCTLHVLNDNIGVTKVGLGALGARFLDDDKVHRNVIDLKNPTHLNHSWADVAFGLDENCNHLINSLPLPFQMSVFMAPKSALYSLGMDSAVLTMSDFSTIFGFLGFVSVYFAEQELGYPFLRATEFLQETKVELLGGEAEEEPNSDYLTDFRLWLSRPSLWVPINPNASETPLLNLTSDEGLWYRCATIDLFLSQECIVKGLSLSYIEKEDSAKKNLLRSLGKTLFEGLSLGLRIDYSGTTNHTDYSLKIPYNNEWGCSILSERISVSPVVVPRPTICRPVESLDRFLGPIVCEMTCVIDVLPATFAALSNLFVGPAESDDPPTERTNGVGHDADIESSGEEEEEEEDSEDDPEATFSFSGGFGDVRVFALDPVLGPHLPVAVVSVASLKVTASKFSEAAEEEPHRGESPPEDMQVHVDGHVWADSFKLGLTRSWEPLLEAYRFTMFYESSRYRGSGVTLRSDVPFHVNITGANLLVVDEVADSMMRQINETFGDGASAPSPSRQEVMSSPAIVRERVRVPSTEEFQGLSVVHEFPRTLSHGDRVAFSLKNMTGQFLRAYRLDAGESEGPKTATLSYVENESATRLLFQPSVSMVSNMGVVEVEFPGLENSPNHNFGGSGSLHELDIQIPGFQWMRSVKIDNFGRHFISLTPRSSMLRERAKEDWRVGNVMKLLVEVGLENGGRELTARSIFSVVNKTTHPMSLILHPNPSFTPGFEDEHGVQLESGEVHQIPVLLLESALRQAIGSMELGCLWLRPSGGALPTTFCEEVRELNAQFSSRPIKLGKAVNDSALLFEGNKGEDIPPDEAETGVQISCPVIGGSGERELAPFCYAVEVGRSPIVKAQGEHKKPETGHPQYVHGPIAYTLSVFAPFVIANLLPEAGRFELMHAVRRTVLWYADLEPGQQISVHSVGLDAPLLLLINLRFCRTPIGEGALVHHGVDPPPDAREHLSRLRSLGKAGKAATKQIGKAITSLGDTPDKRGQERIFIAQDKENRVGVREKRKVPNVKKAGVTAGDSGIDDVDGKTYRVDTTVFFPENCVEETVLVDGVGQRLTLGIENIRGGGGQRRVSIYCPFWVINTTEHALIYRQYNSKHCVSGSVSGPQMDGSLTLSGGHVGRKQETNVTQPPHDSLVRPMNESTIFAGTPGALATSPGRCNLAPDELAPLLQETLSLDDLSRLAFMFNFQEGSIPGGNQKLCVQLNDGRSSSRYQSDWSRGFGLDSVGISQVVDMNCKDGRSLELSMVAQTAPGHLSKYTKIVRFLPRYVVVNNLPYPIRLWQDNSIFRPPSAADITLVSNSRGTSRRWRMVPRRRKKDSGRINQYEALWGREVDIMVEEANLSFPEGTTAHPSALHVMSVPPSTWKPFNLPDSRGDRQLRVGLGGSYNLTASISADVPGEHTLRLTRAVDLRLLKHVSTRASPQYTITLRGGGEFSGELGIWFETEWGTDRSLIIKAIRYDSYCYNKTDVHVGDELLLIDGAPVARMTFAEAMNVLRSRIGEIRSAAPEPKRISARRSSLQFRLSSRFTSSQSIEAETTPAARPLTLTFRTVEERLRRVRLKAARNNASGANHNKIRDAASDINSGSESLGAENGDTGFIKAELKTLHKSMYLVLGTIGSVPYEVHNRTQSSTVYFRQRGCYSHPWQTLKPGASEVYCWEEPMKAKRLTVRVATEDSFVFVTQKESMDRMSELDANISQLAEMRQSSSRRSMFSGQVKDEEDSEFSPSVSVRLEEIGFRDFLHYGGHRSKHLELEVDVVGSTRVLVVRDITPESDTENQLLGHLDALKAKCIEEERRIEQLRLLRGQVADFQDEEMKEEDVALARESTDTARNLMNDFPEEKSITKVHQMVVEVLEATGLSPDNYVGVCNPYVEVSLRSGSGRTNLFQTTKQYHRTYYVRRSVNPCWNSQSFVFDIPPEAVSITRGHAVKVKVRNFRRLSRHAILGRAQIDLHSVRGHSPLLGWFPLAGRTGRRELENSLSHWGRGSIKLKIHWVVSTPALLEYFLILSETRLADLHESVKGMAGQLDKRREEERKKQERMDGFKAVRVNDLAPGHRKQSTPNNLQPRLMRMEAELGASRRASENGRTKSGDVSTSSPKPDEVMPRRNSTFTARHAPSMRPDVEDQISMRRQQLQAVSFGQGRRTSAFMTSGGIGGSASIESFRSWEEAKVFFNDNTLDISFDGDGFNLKLRKKRNGYRNTSATDSTEERQLVGKLNVPDGSPSLMRTAAKQHGIEFAESRTSLEKFARSSLRAALNPGGWLTIRPIQALNLPDSYNGMFVKLRYGSESFASETVDSTVYPTWFRPSDPNGSQEPASAESLEYFPGDLHVYVPPQKTSGSIRLSVVGEGQGQRLNTKTELGVLYIPLGAAITACIDSVEEYFDSQMGEDGSSPVYLRWFPLGDPKRTIPVEGDRKTGSRPEETEKESDHLFKDYFTPCIQLALIWSPEVEPMGGEVDEPDVVEAVEESIRIPAARSSSFNPARSASSEKTNHSSMVENYFNADIGHVSFALVDSHKAQELISGCICDIDVRYWVTKAKTRFGVAVGWFQLDQQDDLAREPVILAPTPSEYVATVFQILALKDNLRSKNDVLSFEFIDFSIAEFDVTLEETLLIDVAEFLSSLRLSGALTNGTTQNESSVEDLSTYGDKKSLFDLGRGSQAEPESTLMSLLSEGTDETKGSHRVYIEQLFLGVVKFNLSYLKGTKETRNVIDGQLGGLTSRNQEGERVFGIGIPSSHHAKSDTFANWSQHTAKHSGGTFTLPSIFTSLLPTVSDAPVRLQGKALNHVFESPGEIIQSIRKFYVNETLKQIYKIIGSLDFVGNPTMLFTSFLSGLRDLILVPSQAFIKSRNPSSVGLGFAKGTLSLFSHSASGFFGFTSKLFAAAGQVVASLSCDREFRTWHRDNVLAEAGNLNRTWKKRGVQSARLMIVRPLGDIAIGVGSGVVGVVLSPIKGYQRNGNIGFVMGVASGVVGVFIKPAVGVLDALSHFTASIHDIAKSVNVLEKRFQPPIKYRLPYIFGINKILMSFDDAQARAVYLLRLFPVKGGRRNADYVTETLVHVEVLHNIGIDTYAIVTSSRLILIRLKSNGGGTVSPTLCWQVAIGGTTSVSSQVAEHGHNGFALTITLKKKAPQETDSMVERQSVTESVAMSSGSGESDLDVIDVGFEPGTEEFDHGTSRGEGGELLEWFTVVAEYQYRRQLAKLHNAISCVAGNLHDVIHDPSLGRTGSTQFYTSFGIFHFEPKRGEDLQRIENNISPFDSFLEELPWRLENEYGAEEPEWLLIARRRAANAALEASSPMLEQASRENAKPAASNQPTGRVKRIARWIAGRRLPTIIDTEDDQSSPSRGEGETEGETGVGQRRRENRGRGANGQDRRDNLSPSDSHGVSRGRSFESLGNDSFMTADDEIASQMLLRESSSDSFQTARRESFMTDPRDSFMTAADGLHARRSGKSVSFSSSSVPSEIEPGRSLEPLDSVSFIAPPVPEPQPRGSSDQTDVQSNRTGDVVPGNQPTGRSPGTPADRLERMENIMEQLLLFSSEQALTNMAARTLSPAPVPAQTPTRGAGDSLRGEIRDLRQQLERQNRAEKAAHEEIDRLREEVTKLTEIVGAGGSHVSQTSSDIAEEEDDFDDEPGSGFARSAPARPKPGDAPTPSTVEKWMKDPN